MSVRVRIVGEPERAVIRSAVRVALMITSWVFTDATAPVGASGSCASSSEAKAGPDTQQANATHRPAVAVAPSKIARTFDIRGSPLGWERGSRAASERGRAVYSFKGLPVNPRV